jgi:hypothetical protein
VEGAQRGARVRSHGVGDTAPGGLVRGERVRRAAGSAQGEHQQLDEAFAEGVRRHEADEFVDVLEGPAELDRAGQPGLEDGEPLLVPAETLGRQVGSLQALGELSAPQLLSAGHRFARPLQPPGVPGRHRLGDQSPPLSQVVRLILFLMTGSVLLPLKATVLNLLSRSVMFGCLDWVFQDGHLPGLLGFTPTGSVEPSIPVLMFCVAYGLSMDYEVFLLARIKEDHERTGDTEDAVGEGIRRSAPLITAAAGILALSFLSYATGGVVFLKELGIGTALTILVDATLVRVVLLPVMMRLAGRANWWAPRSLRRMRIKEAPEGEVLHGEYV